MVIIQFSGPFSNCTLINIYNDVHLNETLTMLSNFLETNSHTIYPCNTDHLICLGNFNRHHPVWEDKMNSHLLTACYLEHEQLLINLLVDYSLFMPLPKDYPTLQASNTKNWTRVDNIFCSDYTTECFTVCSTNPDQHGPATDHVPILSTVKLSIPESTATPLLNYREVDWKKVQ